MASWQFHSLLYQLYLRKNDVPREMRPLFHLGCFAPDLVEEIPMKKRTHFGTTIGRIPLHYGIRACKRLIGFDDIEDQAVRWFFTGYLLHLEIDRQWMSCCILPATPRFLLELRSFRDAGKCYYGEMISIDRYYRGKFRTYDAEARSIELFSSDSLDALRNRHGSTGPEAEKTVNIDRVLAKSLELAPEGIEIGVTRRVVDLLEDTRYTVSERLENRFITEANVERFLFRVDRAMS